MRFVSLGLMCVALSGCSVALDGSSSVFSAQPGKYNYLDCPGIAARTKSSAQREAKLSELMEKASQDTFGPVVNTLVYRDELNQVRADQRELMKAADDKRCMPDLSPTPASLAPVH